MNVYLQSKLLVRKLIPLRLLSNTRFKGAFNGVSGKIVSSIEPTILNQDLCVFQPNHS